MTTIDQNDREAMQLAIDLVMSDQADDHYEGLRKRFGDANNESDPAERDRLLRAAAEFAVYGAQYNALSLKPWQEPPCVLDDFEETITAGVGHRNYEGAKLRRAMSRYGISAYHPDPARAVEEAKRKKR